MTGPFENLQALSYTYDAAGNVTSVTDANNSNQVQSFGYDWLDRLTSAATNGVGIGQYSHTYQYDAIGNITSYNDNAYTYGSQPHAVTAAVGNVYSYDANGNQTSRTIGGVSYTFAYDYENRLTAISGGSVTASFVYDAEGNRVKGTVNGVTTVYVAGIYENEGGKTTHYYEGGAIRRTGYASDNGILYLLQDHLQSSSVIANQNGTVNSRNYFYPFGVNRGGAAFSALTTKRFTGQYHESSLPGGEGLSYYNARWYDAQVGRFLSADTIVPNPGNPQAFNRYSYVKNQPLNRIDPTGRADALPPDGGAPPWRYSPSHYPPAGSTVIGRRWSEYTAFWKRGTLSVGGVFDLGVSVGPNSRYGDGKSYSSMMARTESQFAIYCWFTEQCGSRLYFGPWTAITQEVKIDPQIEQVRMEWAEAGHRLPFVTSTSIDNRDPQSPLGVRLAQGGALLGKEHGGLALDWLFAPFGYGNNAAEGERDPTGYLGSFDRVSIRDAGNGRVLFEVLNVTGFESGSRIPGTTGFIIRNRGQGEPGPGGTFEQIYYWWESPSR